MGERGGRDCPDKRRPGILGRCTNEKVDRTERIEEEIKKGQKEHLEIRASDYDICTIIDRQYGICKRYKQ